MSRGGARSDGGSGLPFWSKSGGFQAQIDHFCSPKVQAEDAFAGHVSTLEPSMGGADPPLIAGSWLLGAVPAFRRDQLGTYMRALEQHGGQTVRFRLGPPRIGLVFDAVFQPDAARQVLATDAARYDKQVPAFDEFRWVLGNGLLTSEGDQWRRDRRIVASIFTRRQVASYVDIMASAAARTVSEWAPAAEGGGEVDVDRAGRHYALDVLGRAVFGEDVAPLVPMLEETIPLLNEFAARRALSPVRIPASWPTPANRRAARARQALWAGVDALVAERRKAGADDGNGGGGGGADLLSLLLEARDPESGEALDDRAVRDQALTFLIAGHETTGATLAFALHLLGRHAPVQQRVRDEVRAVAGDRAVTSGDVEGLQYASQVVHEALRLYPSGHTIVRRAHEPVQLSGYDVPPGRIIAVSVWGIQHNPDVWPDPDRFDPDRFAPGAAAGGGDGQASRYSFLPFGGGPRGCIGQFLATTELVVAVATIVRAYRLEALKDAPDLDVGATVRPEGQLLCRLEPA